MNTPSAAAQVIVSIIPIVGIVMGCIVIFFYIFWDFKYRIFLVEKGFKKENSFNLITFCLLAGLILLTLGISLVVFFLIKEGFSYGVLSGLIPMAVGISMLLFVKISIRLKAGND